jgi:hypothetical protein
MRKVLVLGACHGALVARMAAELAAHNVELIIAEGPETALAAVRALEAAEAADTAQDLDAVEDATLRAPGEDVIVIGGGFGGFSRASARALAFELENYRVAEPLVEPFMLPKHDGARYWQQSNHAFDRKQQGMRAKARRR